MLTLLVALSLAQSKPVEVIRGGTPPKEKKAAPARAAETAVPVAQEAPLPSAQGCTAKEEAAKAELEARAKALDQKAAELRAKEQALEDQQQQADHGAQARQRQLERLQKHGADLRDEYRKAANALAGE